MIDFDVDSTKKNKLELLDCQIDLILKSLEMYNYMYGFIYPRSNKNLSEEENKRISLVRDTYEQILSEYSKSRKSDSILGQKNFKKFA